MIYYAIDKNKYRRCKMFHRYGSERGGFSEYLRKNYSEPHNDAVFDDVGISADRNIHSEDTNDANNTKREFFIFQVIRNIINKIK
jgi:hypothetical protein